LLANTIKIGIAIALVLIAIIGKAFWYSEWLEKHQNIKKIAESRTTYVILLIVAIGLLAGVFQDINAVREALNVPPPSPKAPPPPIFVVQELAPHVSREKASKSVSSSKPPIQINNAPNGIAIGGGTVTNPTVNNFVPPSRSLEGLDRTNLVNALSLTKSKAIVRYPVSDNEASHFAQKISGILKDAGWEVVGDLPIPITGDFPPGLRVGFHGELHPDGGAITMDDRTLEGSVIRALMAAHVQGLYVNSRPNLSAGTIEFLISSNPADPTLR